jgi:hypothetical protein
LLILKHLHFPHFPPQFPNLSTKPLSSLKSVPFFLG